MYIITVAVAVCAGLVFGHASPAADEGSGSCQAKMTAFPLDPSSQCCTSVGQGAINQHPWAALIDYESINNKGPKTLCSGSLISGKYVLTGAHCVVGPVLTIATPTAVRLGEFDSSHEGRDCIPVEGGGEDCNDGPTIIAIESAIPHPKYGSPTKSNDIALIRLKEAAPYTDFIRPICLPTQNLESNPPDHPLYAVTWFNLRSSNLKLKSLINVPFVNQEKCQQIYSQPSRNVMLGQGQLCAGGIEGIDTCKGDGGGPLVYENQGISELTGIVSFGPTPCGQKDIPSVYTNVYEYLDWIKTIIVSIAVRLGEFDSSHEGRDCTPVQVGGERCNDGHTSIAIESTIPHPKFEPPSRSNDIGLIRLKEAAPYTDFIRPVCLPTKNLESMPPDKPLYAISWYNSENKNQKLKTIIKAPFIRQDECLPIYSHISPDIVLGQGQLCAGGIEGIDTCKGDAGSPLVYENQGISELTGIVSFGPSPCGQRNIGSVYTNVYEYLDWIKSIIVS